MIKVIVVETKEEYKRWLAAQKSEYSTLMAQNATTPTAIENSIQVTKSETATKAIAKLEAKN